MGGEPYPQRPKQPRRRPGKVEASLNDKLNGVEWGEFRLGDLFDSSNGNFDLQKEHINHRGDYVITAGLTNSGIMGKSDITARLFDEKTITIDMFGAVFYRQFKYKMVTHARVFSLKPKYQINDEQGLFMANSLRFLGKKFGYENMCSWAKIKDEKIQLPTLNGKIDYAFMESFVSELEAARLTELEAYLQATGLSDTTLTAEESEMLAAFENNEFVWGEFNLKELFGSSTRGRRLKSDDRVEGHLPFVTAGEKDEGISAFIGNKVIIFPKNTTTIDMFGSAKYRNYEYGADDHVAVVHTDKLPKFASIFVTTAIHKTSYAGQFSYSRNFYAKDADELNILLPSTNVDPDYQILIKEIPDYECMNTFISAIQKLVIRDVVQYADRKIAATAQAMKH